VHHAAVNEIEVRWWAEIVLETVNVDPNDLALIPLRDDLA
jgi:hypothetical protein